MSERLYYYTARARDGVRIRGAMEAPSANAAASALQGRDLIVTSMEPSGSVTSALPALLMIRATNRKAQAAFFRSLATLNAAGVSIRRAMEVSIAQSGDARLRETLESVAAQIENGALLSDAFGRHPREFSSVHVAMIRAAELGGVLDETLDQLASLLEYDLSIRKKLSSALAYPALVATAAIGLVAFLMGSIVPMFATMYEEMHVPLPAITSVLISAATWLRSWQAIVVLATPAALALVAWRGSAPRLRDRIDRLRLRLPVIGAIVRRATLARLARAASSLLRAGVPLVSALDAVGEILGAGVYRGVLGGASRAVSEGRPFADTLVPAPLFEPVFVQLVRVGEETGTLDAMLARLARHYEDEVETAFATLGAVLEPAMIVGLGGVVGFIVAAIFIPLYTLIGSIK